MPQVNIWRLIAHHEDRDAALAWSLKNGRIAIGWGAIGDIRARGYESAEDLRDAMRHFYPQHRGSLNGSLSLWNFFEEMKDGDLVIMRGATRSRVVNVVGDYFFDNKNFPFPDQDGDYHHQRRVGLTQLDPDKLWQSAGKMARDGGSIYRSLVRCEKPWEAP